MGHMTVTTHRKWFNGFWEGDRFPQLSHKDMQQISILWLHYKDSEMHYNHYTIITQYIIIPYKFGLLSWSHRLALFFSWTGREIRNRNLSTDQRTLWSSHSCGFGDKGVITQTVNRSPPLWAEMIRKTVLSQRSGQRPYNCLLPPPKWLKFTRS